MDDSSQSESAGELSGFQHRYIPSPDATSPTLLLLHGTGGDENDLLGLGRSLAPSAGLLSPRGKVLENGAPRFFRRLAEGVFDEADLLRRTDELKAFIAAAGEKYRLDASRIVAVGFSNGANIAASLLLRHPGALAAAMLLRAMVPFIPTATPDLGGKPILMLSGQADPIVPAYVAERLAELFRAAGANVSLQWTPGGHGLTQADILAARAWLAAQENSGKM